MSCGSLKHRFEEQMRDGISFENAMEIYQDVEGSIAAHQAELADLERGSVSQSEIKHLKEHIAEGESLMQQIRSMKLH